MLTAKYEWNLQAKSDSEQVTKVAKELGLDSVIVQILFQRGYQTKESIETFLQPSDDELNDASLLFDIDKAVERIQEAAFTGEKIVVYGDYDVDGLTATAVMYTTLEQLGAEVSYYIPDRFKDGYGPNKDAYQRLIDDGAQLIVTVDNGVAGHEAIAYASERGVDVVVTDHHELPKDLPNAYAIVHPRHPKGSYPFGYLAGVGVSFKVATALLEEVPSEMLDLVALGTIADLVPMVKENRLLVKYGLEVLRANQRLGLNSLYELAQIRPSEIDEQTVSFQLAPRLNSLGRMADANIGVELLTTEDQNQANKLAATCQELNEQRKKLVDEITKQALELLKQQPKQVVNVVAAKGWHEGVLGIVASRLVEQTGRPSIVLVENKDGSAKGSGRSIAGFDLFLALNGHKEIFTQFGGHDMACGLTLPIENLSALQELLNQAMKVQGLKTEVKPNLDIAAKVDLSQLSLDFYKQLQALAPFGVDNEEPVFMFAGYENISAKSVGQDNNHLRVELVGPSGVRSLSGVAFNLGADVVEEVVAHSSTLEIVGTLAENVWRNQTSLQIMIKDLMIKTNESVTTNENWSNGIIDKRTNNLSKSLFQDEATYIFFNPKIKEQIEPILGSNASAILAKKITEIYQANKIYLVDCPNSLSELTELLPRLSVNCLYPIFYQKDNAYIVGLPNRQQFAKVYRFAESHRNVDVYRRLDELASYLKIRKELVIFILQVFFELGFVKIDNGLMNYVPNAKPHSLEDTDSYRGRKLKMEAQATLVFSNSTDLTQYLTKYLPR